jgi:hypothetical protein
MENKLSFNKRILLTKKQVFEGVQQVELDKTANDKAGYHSLKSIMIVLNPLLDKYGLDLELDIKKTEVIITWYDCLEDKQRKSSIDISKIENVSRLPSMTNEVQSMGACLTYVRRYAYTTALNLNATDTIENSTGKGNGDKPPTKQQLTEKQLKRLFALQKSADIADEQLKEYLKKNFKIDSRKKLNKLQYEKLCKDLEKQANSKNQVV